MNLNGNMGADRYDMIREKLTKRFTRVNSILRNAMMKDGRLPLTITATPEEKLQNLNAILGSNEGLDKFRAQVTLFYQGEPNIDELVTASIEKAKNERLKLMTEMGLLPKEFGTDALEGINLEGI